MATAATPTQAPSVSPRPDRPRRALVLRWVSRLAPWAPIVGLAGAAAARVLKLQFWPAELLWHFTEIFFILAVALTLVLLALRRYAPAAAAAALAVFFGIAAHGVPGDAMSQRGSLVPAAAAKASEAQAPEESALTLVTHNLYVHNNRRDDLAAWLRRQDADVVVLQEVKSEMAEVLAAAKDVYPEQFFAWPEYYEEKPKIRGQLSGLAVLSRYPLSDRAMFRRTKYSAPVASAAMSLPDGQRIRLVVVHTSNPVRRSGLRARNALMAALAAELNRFSEPIVLAGDFNATPYTPAFVKMLLDARLTASRAYPGTYPQFAGAFGLPIDHVLVRGARIVDIAALDAFGSDHRPLRADLIVPSGTNGK